MGSNDGDRDEKPLHQINLDTYFMAKTPITNAQYYLFVKATQHTAPVNWENDRPLKGKESHPVTNVVWNDAVSYCHWLSETTGKKIQLPSEAEWEKAARGSKDKRAYPWGDTFDPMRCNSDSLRINDTTPVGIFLNGAGPYGCLDMSGNVWEWTRSLEADYPYTASDGREEMDSSGTRVLRGGAFDLNEGSARCAFRFGFVPSRWFRDLGFRVMLSPF